MLNVDNVLEYAVLVQCESNCCHDPSESITNNSLTGTTAAVGLQKVIETNYLTVGPVAFFLSQNIHIEVGQECTVWEDHSD